MSGRKRSCSDVLNSQLGRRVAPYAVNLRREECDKVLMRQGLAATISVATQEQRTARPDGVGHAAPRPPPSYRTGRPPSRPQGRPRLAHGRRRLRRRPASAAPAPGPRAAWPARRCSGPGPTRRRWSTASPPPARSPSLALGLDAATAATYQAFLKLLRAWTAALAAALIVALRRRMQEDLAERFAVAGFAAFGVDGSRLQLPRTASNEARFSAPPKRREAEVEAEAKSPVEVEDRPPRPPAARRPTARRCG